MAKVLKMKRVCNVALDQCPYGAHSTKGTRIVTSASWMASVALRCADVRPHFHIPGGLVGKTWDPVSQSMVWKTSRVAETHCSRSPPMVGKSSWIQLVGREGMGEKRTKANQLKVPKEKLSVLKRQREELVQKMSNGPKDAKLEDQPGEHRANLEDKSKKEVREEEDAAAIGGLRDPRKAVANSKKLKTTGHRIRQALERAQFENDMSMAPELIQRARRLGKPCMKNLMSMKRHMRKATRLHF